jgi:two-component system chemotaxis sensor kinase CheA
LRPTGQAGESIRVSIEKLDALLAQAGELAVVNIRIAQRLTEIRAFRDSMLAWRREWRACRSMRTSLRRLSGTAKSRSESESRELEALLRFTENAEERVRQMCRQVETIVSQMQHDVSQISLVTHGLEGDVQAVRLLPVSTIFVPLERTVRDLARSESKDVRLLLSGQRTEIDRKILEVLRDPLLHMVRNAVDHGIEPPDKRLALGKSRTGTVRLTATQRGGALEVEVEDDGAGLLPPQLRASAVIDAGRAGAIAG